MNGVLDLGAGELAGRMSRRELSAVEVTRACLDRAHEVDAALGTLLCLNPRAEDEARGADRRLAAGKCGPLCGVPVVIKDNIATRDLATTCASRILESFVPVRDATVVTRLRDAGAVVLGKTNMDEFGMGSSSENSAFGPVRNPWSPERVAGGSSGGSAAAVAARIAPLALGSDTGGSVRQPAAFCGVVGVKPTYGRVSRSGLVAFGSSLEQVGPLAASVRDCARLLHAIAGHDAADATSARRPVDDYEGACDAGVRGLDVGLPREFFAEGLDPEVEDGVVAAAGILEREGARVREVSLPHSRYALPVYYVVATAEASSNLARYDGVRYGVRVECAGDLDAAYRATRGRKLGPEVRRRILLGTYVLSAGYFEAFYAKAMRVRALLRRDFVKCFETGIDVLLGPTTPTPAFRLGEKTADPLAMYLCDAYTASVNLAGLPAISVPAAMSAGGLPVGVQMIGPDFGEELVLRAAAVVEQRVGRFGPPRVGGADDETSRGGPRADRA